MVRGGGGGLSGKGKHVVIDRILINSNNWLYKHNRLTSVEWLSKNERFASELAGFDLGKLKRVIA